MRNSYVNIDITGERHGMLTAVKKANHGKTWWVCKCDCGVERELPVNRFYDYLSCGCLEEKNRLRIAERTRTHGKTNTRLYSIYCGMKNRCNNTHYRYYGRYGGRGIALCEEWDKSFEAFEKWAYDNGYNENLDGKTQSIDRIDVDGNYEPSNCKWSTQTEQVRNRSNTRWVIYKGEKVNPYDFARNHCITNKAYVYRHLNMGETGEQIIEKWQKLHPLSKKEITPAQNCRV